MWGYGSVVTPHWCTVTTGSTWHCTMLGPLSQILYVIQTCDGLFSGRNFRISGPKIQGENLWSSGKKSENFRKKIWKSTGITWHSTRHCNVLCLLVIPAFLHPQSLWLPQLSPWHSSRETWLSASLHSNLSLFWSQTSHRRSGNLTSMWLQALALQRSKQSRSYVHSAN